MGSHGLFSLANKNQGRRRTALTSYLICSIPRSARRSYPFTRKHLVKSFLYWRGSRSTGELTPPRLMDIFGRFAL